MTLVRTNVVPLPSVHAALYRGVAYAAAVMLRLRKPGAISWIGLRGSLSTAFLIPGLSDVDLFVVLTDETGRSGHQALAVFYARLAKWCPLLDPHPWLLRWGDVDTLYRENPSFRFRVLEGQQVFRTLHGTSRLRTLPRPSVADVALAHLFDLKARLTYFNALCLDPESADVLDRCRAEHMLFKITLDLVRLARQLMTGQSTFDRGEICARYISGELGLETMLGTGDDRALRQFVEFTSIWRLRRSYVTVTGMPPDVLEARVFRACLDLCVMFWAHDDVRENALLAVEHEHFYDAGRFRPTGHTVRALPEDAIHDYPTLKRLVREARDGGWNVVVPYKGLRVNLSNRDPGIGHCTVVSWPEAVP